MNLSPQLSVTSKGGLRIRPQDIYRCSGSGGSPPKQKKPAKPVKKKKK